MIKKILKAKHWQLFLFTFGLPFLFQIISLVSIGLGTANQVATQMESSIPKIIFLMPFIGIIFIVTLFYWFWSVTLGLKEKLPETSNINYKRFKFFFFFPFIYILLISIFAGSLFVVANNSPESIDQSIMFGAVGIIFPLHLFSMFCMFHTLYYTAKTFKSVELQKDATFSDFAGEFFMIWFFPIGIWIIQPKINEMVK